MPFAPGTRFGPFEIIAAVESAGAGELYRARDHEHGRDVAMRVLTADFGTTPERRTQFEQEARGALLSHPNIITIYGIGTDANAAYIVSEPIDGATLREVLSRGALPVRTAIQYAAEIAQGLVAAHNEGIVHRDSKPENILVGDDRRVCIMGFGLATLTQAESALTDLKGVAPGAGLGTPGYMSPEQVRGLPADSSSDMFTFGALVYEMLTGARAFSGDTPLETMTAVAKSDPARALEAERPLPPALVRLVGRCLKKHPVSRPTAREAARALDALLEETSSREVARSLRPERGTRSPTTGRQTDAISCIRRISLASWRAATSTCGRGRSPAGGRLHSGGPSTPPLVLSSLPIADGWPTRRSKEGVRMCMCCVFRTRRRAGGFPHAAARSRDGAGMAPSSSMSVRTTG